MGKLSPDLEAGTADHLHRLEERGLGGDRLDRHAEGQGEDDDGGNEIPAQGSRVGDQGLEQRQMARAATGDDLDRGRGGGNGAGQQEDGGEDGDPEKGERPQLAWNSRIAQARTAPRPPMTELRI